MKYKNLDFLKNLFGKTKISWRFLLIFSVTVGIFVGILARIPLFENTSFSDIAVVLDMWIVLAIFIIVNCETRKEAVEKTFVFFLISQPLIYLTEALLSSIFSGADFFGLTGEYFNNYYFHGGNWFFWTLLTLPGAALAFEIKKENLLASFILSVSTGFLAFVGGYGILNSIFRTFPNHLLNGILCLFFAFSLGFLILKSRRQKIINLAISGIFAVVGIVSFSVINFSNTPKTITLEYTEGTEISEIVSSDDSLVKIDIENGGKTLIFTSTGNYGSLEVEAKDKNGEKHLYYVDSLRDGIFVSEL